MLDTRPRRRFLQGLILAAGAALFGGSNRPRRERSAADAARPAGQGYRLTEHIRKYYAKARW